MSRGSLWLDVNVTARRFGVKGPRAADALREAGLAVPAERNTWSPLRPSDGEHARDVIGRLGNTEFFVEESSAASGISRLESLTRDFPGAWPVLREDAGFVIGGSRAPAALAEVCNIDFAALDATHRPLFMTLMTGVGVLVFAQATADGTVFRIWCDPSFGPYLRETLEEVTGTGE